MPEPHVVRVFEQMTLRIGDGVFERRHWELLSRWSERQAAEYLQVMANGIRFHQWVGVIEVEDLGH